MNMKNNITLSVNGNSNCNCRGIPIPKQRKQKCFDFGLEHLPMANNFSDISL